MLFSSTHSQPAADNWREIVLSLVSTFSSSSDDDYDVVLYVVLGPFFAIGRDRISKRDEEVEKKCTHHNCISFRRRPSSCHLILIIPRPAFAFGHAIGDARRMNEQSFRYAINQVLWVSLDLLSSLLK